MKTNVNLEATVIPKAHAPIANTAAVITLAATENCRHVIDKVFGGYDAVATGGSLTIAITVDGTAVSMAFPVYGIYPVILDFDKPLQADEDTAVTITLAAGGAGIIGSINAVIR
jgi:hypothetical protein